jgi:hypothetical protein
MSHDPMGLQGLLQVQLYLSFYPYSNTTLIHFTTAKRSKVKPTNFLNSLIAYTCEHCSLVNKI